MLVQFNSDKNIEGTEALALQSEETVRDALTYFSEQITRIEIHVSDENSSKKVGGDAHRCGIEARVSGRPPIAVSHSASTVAQSVDGAADKLKRAIEGLMGRKDAVIRKRRASKREAVVDLQEAASERAVTASPDVEVTAPPDVEVTAPPERVVATSPVAHADGNTRRKESPTLEGRVPLPEEITGRASGTSEDLIELFENKSGAHLTDGFRGGSEDESLNETDGSTDPRPAAKHVDRSESDAR